jgi:hypothetical protein
LYFDSVALLVKKEEAKGKCKYKRATQEKKESKKNQK